MPNNWGVQQHDHFSPIVKAIELAGSLTGLAKIAGVKPPTVSEWKTGERPVPARRAVLIEQGLGLPGFRKDLRPDDWREHWPELAAAEAQGPTHA